MLSALILYISGRTYNLKSTPNNRFFEKLLTAVLIYSQSFCQKSAERISPKKYFFDVRPGFTSNKLTHYLQDYGDTGTFRSIIVADEFA